MLRLVDFYLFTSQNFIEQAQRLTFSLFLPFAQNCLLVTLP